MELKFVDLVDGQQLFICDIRVGEYRDPMLEPIRKVKPVKVIFVKDDECFVTVKKDETPSRKKIAIWDTTDCRSHGVPVKMFTTLAEAKICYKEQRQAIVKAINDKVNTLNELAREAIERL